MSESTDNSTLLPPNYFSVINEKALLEAEKVELESKKKNLEAENQELESKKKNLKVENQELKRNLEIFRKALFGAKSEKLPKLSRAIQEELFKTELESRPVSQSEPEVAIPAHTRKKRKCYQDKNGNQSHFPPDLPRQEIVLEPEEESECQSCGKDKVKISEKVTEKLCVVPAKFYVKRFVRPVYGCNCGKCKPSSAQAPSSPLPKTVLDVSFLALMLVQKFAWHLPFFRQSQMLRELGVVLSRDVLISAALKLSSQLNLIVVQMAREIKSCDLVQIDESPTVVGIRDGTGKKSFKKNSYFWPILGGKQIVFTYTGDRKHCNVGNILGDDFSGVLLSDGYQAYLEYCKSHPEASLALCWDHARRRFYEIKDDEPLALEALEFLKQLYRVEKQIKELVKTEQLSPDKITKYRKEHALPILNDFKTWCEVVKNTPNILPKDKLSAACSYVLNHWSGLTLYLEHGFVPISNIAVEQQIRNLKLGAKNWLFAASEAGAETVAIMNSLVCTCKMNGINILEYFTDILSRLDVDCAKKLTPLAWKAEQDTIKDKNTTDKI